MYTFSITSQCLGYNLKDVKAITFLLHLSMQGIIVNNVIVLHIPKSRQSMKVVGKTTFLVDQ